VLYLRLQVGRVRSHDDLQHAQVRVVLEGALLVPEAAYCVHDHQVIGVRDQLADRQVVVAHHAARHPGDDLVVGVLVQPDPGTRLQYRLGDHR